ncbi:hypothetical protein ACTXT7_011824 [Hymenolepis weldensis]
MGIYAETGIDVIICFSYDSPAKPKDGSASYSICLIHERLVIHRARPPYVMALRAPNPKFSTEERLYRLP